jgi:NAD(P)-dependent dehydrogenase (short-subunit alcohol dehydrogenase family)
MNMRQLWNRSWDVNTTGTQIVTATFIPLLLRSDHPRLLFVTSGLSALTNSDNLSIMVNKSPPKGWPKDSSNVGLGAAAYRSVKTGLNMMMREWTRILREDGVKVFSISPGILATGLGGLSQDTFKKIGAEDPAVGGNFIKDVIEGKRDSDTGKVILRGGIQPW